MSEETTASFPQEGDNNPFEAGKEGEGNPTDSPSEETKTEETPAPEENKSQAEETIDGEKKPFNQDPRWKEREENWKNRFNEQETRHTEAINELRKLVEKGADKPKPNGGGDEALEEIPAWFNGDQEQWNQFSDWNKGLVAKAEKNIEERMRSQQTEEQTKIKDATDYMSSQIDEIEANKDLNPEGKKIDRNKLLKFTLDNEIVDTKGRWNYKVAYKLMSNSQPTKKDTENKQDRKNLAAATGTEHKTEDKPDTTMTSDDFQQPANRPW